MRSPQCTAALVWILIERVSFGKPTSVGFATGAVAGHPGDVSPGAFFGAQALGVAAVAVWSAIATAVSALAVSLFLPMRVSEDDERQGLDIASHGERGCEFD